MRTPVPHAEPGPAPPQRLTLAMLKPGAPRERLRARLADRFAELAAHTLTLTPAQVRLLYPDAYGADFVAATTAYLTGEPVTVLVLLDQDLGAGPMAAYKRAVRAEFAAERLVNHLHMPDHPAEALADLALLAGPAELRRHYYRWERERADDRMAVYRAALADHGTGPGTGAELVLPARW